MQIQVVDDEEFVSHSLGSSHPAWQVPCFDNSSTTSDSGLDLSEPLSGFFPLKFNNRIRLQRVVLWMCMLTLGLGGHMSMY